MSTLAGDHAVCAALLTRSGSSFALPIGLLPAPKRRGTTALYAFCRRADDLVDDAADPVAAGRGLATFAESLEGALAGSGSGDPVIRAVVDTVRRFAIPAGCLRDVLDGVGMDLVPRGYETFADLEAYCNRVAGAVGVAAIHIWGFTDPAAPRVALECGLAFQLTNILRDIPEDLARGRIYLPRADMAECGCSEDDLRSGRMLPAFARLAALEIDRARAAYTRAGELDRLLTTDGRIVFRAMFGVYGGLLAAVRRAGARIFTTDVSVSRSRLAAAAVATLVRGTQPARWL